MNISTHVIRTALLTCAAAVAATACGPSQSELEAEQARANRLQQELRNSRAQQEALQTRLAELEKQNEDITSQLAVLGEDREGLKNRLAELAAREQQSRERLATFRGLLQRFKSMIESGQLTVEIDRKRNLMLVKLPEGVLFDSGKAKLKDEGKTTLTEVSVILKEIPDRSFQIAGHTDNVPIRTRRFPSNWELSAARSVDVAKFLVERGIPANRISAAGFAATQPVAPNDSRDGRQKNRRTEIVLLPKLDELPDLGALESELKKTAN